MNFAFKKATKDLVALLDDDDEWMPGKLELQRRILEARPDVLYSFTSFVTVLQDGTESPGFLVDARGPFEDWKAENGPGVPFSSLAELPVGQEDFPVFVGNEYGALMKADYMVGGLLVVRRKAAERELHYPDDVRYCKDWDFQTRLSKLGSVAYLDRDLYRWYEHPGTRYADLAAFEKATCRLTILQRIWGRDEAFLAKHGDEYQVRVDAERNHRVREFLVRGDVEAARKELRLVRSGSPLSFRILALLPGRAVTGILAVRRFLNRALER
jgi:glycosyltransferase involved in cell wall biosynthesis